MTEPNLTPDTALILASEVTITITGDRLVVEAHGQKLELDASMLSVVDLFRVPRSMRSALNHARIGTKLDWMQVSESILLMHQAGVLVGGKSIPLTGSGYASAKIHVEMLNDRERTASFVHAVREVVREGDVVIDVGTGTGVLAIAAAQAGAKRVYAIERSPIAEVAQRMFERNGVADRVTLIREHSTLASLPEKADVMVSELVGNDPFAEHILSTTRDAIGRLLKEDARMVPAAMRVFIRPLQLSKELREKHLFQADVARAWTDAYGIDFSGLEQERNEKPFFLELRAAEAGALQALGPAVQLTHVDLRDPPETIDARARLRFETAGRFDAAAIYFELLLSKTQRMDNDPWRSPIDSHWRIPVWLLPRDRKVSPGDAAQVHYGFVNTGASLQVD